MLPKISKIRLSYLVLLCGLSLTNCKTSSNNNSSNISFNCNKIIIPFLKDNWKYFPNGDYYIASDTLKKALETNLYSCFIGRDTTWLVATLGKHQSSKIRPVPIKPGDQAVGSIRYQLSGKVCSQPNDHCLYYYFFYNITGKIVRHRLDDVFDQVIIMKSSH